MLIQLLQASFKLFSASVIDSMGCTGVIGEKNADMLYTNTHAQKTPQMYSDKGDPIFLLFRFVFQDISEGGIS